MKGVMKRLDDFTGIAAALHAGSVQTKAAGMITDGKRKRQRVFDDTE